jgi:hypothetical protein
MTSKSGSITRQVFEYFHAAEKSLRNNPITFDIRVISIRVFFLLLALYINRKVKYFFPEYWILIPISVLLVLAWERYREEEYLLVRLWKLIGIYSAIYSLTFYPLVPADPDSIGSLTLQTLLIAGWVMSIVSGLICLRVASFSLFPPAFVIWSKTIAGLVSGLPVTIDIDVVPLAEVSICIGLGLLISRLYDVSQCLRVVETIERGRRHVADRVSKELYSNLLLYIAISIHLANYFWSFQRKATLDGPLFSWVSENNPVYIFLAALDDGHILFSGYPTLVNWAIRLFDSAHIFSNIWVFVIQAVSIIAFFIPRRAFLSLLLMFDVMHVAIILIAGANFFPWIVLNIFIIIIVADAKFPWHNLTAKLIATGFILIAPHFAEVAKLGWYDSGANNNVYILAVDEQGSRYRVPSNFFTFYSYSFGHMDYGSPEPWTSFFVGSPNGGTWNYRTFVAGRSCDVSHLQTVRKSSWDYREEVSSFIRNYHDLTLNIISRLGIFPYDLYPHHFFVPLGESWDFRKLDKKHIVAYIYRRESVCLSIENGEPRRRVVASSELRIDVAGANRNAER